MARLMKCIAWISFILSMFFCILNMIFDIDIWLSLTITFSTIAYHFVMRLLVGFMFDRIMNNKVNYNRKWFQVGKAELRFYNMIKVKRWKHKMPTYDAALFSPQKHTWDEIAQAMCQAVLVLEVIVVLSFVPITMSIWWGAFEVFLITSILAACIDLSFVIMQRYNRPRVLLLYHKRRNI